MTKNLESTTPGERSKSVSAASAIALTEQMHSLFSEIKVLVYNGLAPTYW